MGAEKRKAALCVLLLLCWSVVAEEEDGGYDGVVVTQQDYQALQAFKHALVDPHGALKSWNDSGIGACSGGWLGIKCVQGQVIAIQIPWRGLGGRIAEQVGQLSALRKLNLHDNMLRGPVPSSLAYLRNLRGVYLFNNKLSGHIPPGICNSPSFQALDLSNNLLTGTIPASLAKSENLYRINLSFNNLTGSLPSELAASPSLTFLNLRNNNLTGKMPDQWGRLDGNRSFQLRSLDLSHNAFSGGIPVSFGNLQKLRVLDLSHNYLNHSIPSELGNMTALESLDLSFNKLQRSIPASLSSLKKLNSLNVSYNNLSGSVPVTLSRKFRPSSFTGNSQLCGYDTSHLCPTPPLPPVPSPSASATSPKKTRKKTILLILIILGSILGFLGIISVIVCLCFVCRKSSEDASAKAGTEKGGAAAGAAGAGVAESGEVGGKLVHFDGPLVFTADDLLCATAEVMGKSTYGTMYKATLEDGNQVAVKRLRERIAKGQREFEVEANALGKVRHPNLLALRAYYWGPKDEKLLVFDFMPGGSLAAFLHARGPETPMNWTTRLKIAIGAARGLAFLHKNENIIHGNLTSSNILLDANMNAKIADFGLSRLMTPAANSNVIATAGALGYRAPELTKLKKANTKTDVYSFGIVLLELLTGKAPGESMTADNGMDLPEWVASIVKEEWTNEVFDLELTKDATSAGDELLNTLQLAMHCVDPTASSRPDMEEVVQQLEQIRPELSQSEAGTTQQQ